MLKQNGMLRPGTFLMNGQPLCYTAGIFGFEFYENSCAWSGRSQPRLAWRFSSFGNCVAALTKFKSARPPRGPQRRVVRRAGFLGREHRGATTFANALTGHSISETALDAGNTHLNPVPGFGCNYQTHLITRHDTLPLAQKHRADQDHVSLCRITFLFLHNFASVDRR